jgi:hypothetical protein
MNTIEFMMERRVQVGFVYCTVEFLEIRGGYQDNPSAIFLNYSHGDKRGCDVGSGLCSCTSYYKYELINSDDREGPWRTCVLRAHRLCSIMTV